MKAAGPSEAAFCIDNHCSYQVQFMLSRYVENHCMSSDVEKGQMAQVVLLAVGIDVLRLRWQGCEFLGLQKTNDTW